MGRLIPGEVRVRPLEAGDLEGADRILRVAFGTHWGLERPEEAFGDADPVRTRFRADPAAAFGAELGAELVGSNFATRWGRFGFFGPLSVRVDLWGQGIAGHLVEAALAYLDAAGVAQAGLFTFPESVKHVGLYTKYGFWPRHLVAVLEQALEDGAPAAASAPTTFATEAATRGADAVLGACRRLTDALCDGLDLEREVRAVDDQGLGDTVLCLDDDGELDGFAVCHLGAGSEAGTGRCYVKFAAARPGRAAPARFERLLDACAALARAKGAATISAGVSTAREEAHRALLRRGWRATRNGIAMLRPNVPGLDRPGVYVLDDLR